MLCAATDKMVHELTKDVTVTVKPGDKVVVATFVGTDIKLDGTDYKFVKQEDILAVVTD